MDAICSPTAKNIAWQHSLKTKEESMSADSLNSAAKSSASTHNLTSAARSSAGQGQTHRTSTTSLRTQSSASPVSVPGLAGAVFDRVVGTQSPPVSVSDKALNDGMVNPPLVITLNLRDGLPSHDSSRQSSASNSGTTTPVLHGRERARTNSRAERQHSPGNHETDRIHHSPQSSPTLTGPVVMRLQIPFSPTSSAEPSPLNSPSAGSGSGTPTPEMHFLKSRCSGRSVYNPIRDQIRQIYKCYTEMHHGKSLEEFKPKREMDRYVLVLDERGNFVWHQTDIFSPLAGTTSSSSSSDVEDLKKEVERAFLTLIRYFQLSSALDCDVLEFRKKVENSGQHGKTVVETRTTLALPDLFAHLLRSQSGLFALNCNPTLAKEVYAYCANSEFGTTYMDAEILLELLAKQEALITKVIDELGKKQEAKWRDCKALWKDIKISKDKPDKDNVLKLLQQLSFSSELSIHPLDTQMAFLNTIAKSPNDLYWLFTSTTATKCTDGLNHAKRDLASFVYAYNELKHEPDQYIRRSISDDRMRKDLLQLLTNREYRKCFSLALQDMVLPVIHHFNVVPQFLQFLFSNAARELAQNEILATDIANQKDWRKLNLWLDRLKGVLQRKNG